MEYQTAYRYCPTKSLKALLGFLSGPPPVYIEPTVQKPVRFSGSYFFEAPASGTAHRFR